MKRKKAIRVTYHQSGVYDCLRSVLFDVILDKAALCVDKGKCGITEPSPIERRLGGVLVGQ